MDGGVTAPVRRHFDGGSNQLWEHRRGGEREQPRERLGPEMPIKMERVLTDRENQK